ncbi:GtrA family protein [Martelella mangrovi]|uniref:Flippase GtrA n=1 Tax=Martelella mangrovi TaxID=1397477 RepID=A0ABV2IGU9_9HYPH
MNVWEIFRFLAVGGTGAALYFFGALVLNKFGLLPQLASFIAYAALVPCMYAAQRVVTFKSKEPILASFFKYVLTQAASLLTSYLLPFLLFRNGHISPAMSFALVLVVTACLNYFLLKFWTFRKTVGLQNRQPR